MHLCAEEIAALLLAVPAVRLAWVYLRAWWG